MKPGRQWLFFDADFFDNSFTSALTEHYGWAGVGLFLAFLCACKTSHPQGQIRYRTEFEAVEMMGISELPLINSKGDLFTLEEFWGFTGRYKQTHRTTRGNTIYVGATGWDQWQESRAAARSYERERKRRYRQQAVPKESRNSPDVVPFQSHFSPETLEQNRRSETRNVRDNVPLERERERDKEMSRTKSGSNPPRIEPPAYREWVSEAPPDEPIVNVRDALARLRLSPKDHPHDNDDLE